MNIVLIIFILCSLAIVIASFIIDKLDFVSISLFLCVVVALITALSENILFEDILLFIEFKALIIILSMSIFSKIAQDSFVLEYFSIRLFRLSKGNLRVFFYIICILSTLLSAIIIDVIVVIILVPIVIRLCNYLETRSSIFLIGIAISINIGSILSPFSSGENIIISTYFDLNFVDFIINYWTNFTKEGSFIRSIYEKR
ncbi:MAG: hypothetical protein JXA99_01450 [Candidatus Lokiarchaeota archaeon]|nr:hypothetical protein [Candidatus Lokiarchaeota archaeon]